MCAMVPRSDQWNGTTSCNTSETVMSIKINESNLIYEQEIRLSNCSMDSQGTDRSFKVMSMSIGTNFGKQLPFKL